MLKIIRRNELSYGMIRYNTYWMEPYPVYHNMSFFKISYGYGGELRVVIDNIMHYIHAILVHGFEPDKK
jgi:hypothetical protein